MATETVLYEDAGVTDSRRLFSSRGIWTFVFVGAAVLVTIFSTMMWADNGFLVETWSWGRIVTALAAILYGLALGWMIYPRRLRF